MRFGTIRHEWLLAVCICSRMTRRQSVFFGDVAGDPQTMVARHINDHELICCGVLNEETGVIVDDTAKLVITGAAWKAAQTPVEGEENK